MSANHSRTASNRPQIAPKESAVFLGLGTGRTHLAIGLAVRACQTGHRVAFSTAAEWIDYLAAAHHAGLLQTKPTKLSGYPRHIRSGFNHRRDSRPFRPFGPPATASTGLRGR